MNIMYVCAICHIVLSVLSRIFGLEEAVRCASTEKSRGGLGGRIC